MNEITTAPLAAVFYASGLLIWPICALLWRKRRRTRALRLIFFLELGCQIFLYCGVGIFPGLLEHGYYWLVLMILANIVFTPVAVVAAIYDYVTGKVQVA